MSTEYCHLCQRPVEARRHFGIGNSYFVQSHPVYGYLLCLSTASVVVFVKAMNFHTYSERIKC